MNLLTWAAFNLVKVVLRKAKGYTQTQVHVAYASSRCKHATHSDVKSYKQVTATKMWSEIQAGKTNQTNEDKYMANTKNVSVANHIFIFHLIYFILKFSR